MSVSDEVRHLEDKYRKLQEFVKELMVLGLEFCIKYNPEYIEPHWDEINDAIKKRAAEFWVNT